ncbi:hypothetical protein MVG78_02715 [Roseomonas gilardii subsp. gilardii]|uniref:hypothetical protein n=1 Tax=Roseomonas gilardii TaxID=257708 RepID=UPI001FFB7ACA|nr:hypothetical protein [Roseomonas gilardii]UPG73111.1 hypothetical protein MVG78_02715 [Roseomonas gilardii subsp. gilardii]
MGRRQMKGANRRTTKPRAKTPENPVLEQERRGGPAEAEIARLRQELREARATLERLALEREPEAARTALSRRLAELEEARQVARGHAVEAALARSRAEADLQALRNAISHAPGLSGWLLRRAQRRLEEKSPRQG